MNIYTEIQEKNQDNLIPLCQCGKPRHLDKAYSEKGYTQYCSDACSKKYRSENKEYNKILSNKEWLVDQFVNQKKAKSIIAQELNCSVTVVNKWLKKHEITQQKSQICQEFITVNYDDINPDIELTKENIEYLLKTYTNKSKLIEKLNLEPVQFRRIVESFGIAWDGRKHSNLRRKHDIPDKKILLDLYHEQNLTLLDISKKYSISNVTVRKWFDHHNIKILDHSDNMRNRVIVKTRNTMLERYGNTEWFATDTAKRKIANTFTTKYGVPYHPINNVSKTEIEVLDYFNSLISGFKNTKIHGIELDGYNPDINIAFEYCGLYWHSETRKGNQLHEKKYKICKENNIRLFTIFEDEWLNRQEQVKGFIRAALNKNEIKLYARKLTLNKFDCKNYQCKKFIDDYHIQGIPALSGILQHFTLTDNGDIIACMTFSRHPRNETEIVLSRYCVKDGCAITGGAQRLFSAAINYFKCNIKTWSDNRWTEGALYSRLGFELHQELKKDYSYVVLSSANRRVSKQSMTKKKIQAREDQTEYQRALELGFDRIWDCGKKTWIFKYGSTLC